MYAVPGAVTTLPSRVSYVTSGAEIPGGMAAPAGVAYPQMAPQIYAPSAMVSPGMQTQTRVVTLSVSEAEVLLAQKAWSDAINTFPRPILREATTLQLLPKQPVSSMAMATLMCCSSQPRQLKHSFDPQPQMPCPTLLGTRRSRMVILRMLASPSTVERDGQCGFDNHKIHVSGNVAIAMGNYFFTSAADGSKTKVEYTFGYKKNADGKVRIFLHHSSVPYSVPAATASGAITKEEVKSVQAAWANAIRSISKTYLDGGDYVAAAAKAAGELYGYGHTNVLLQANQGS